MTADYQQIPLDFNAYDPMMINRPAYLDKPWSSFFRERLGIPSLCSVIFANVPRTASGAPLRSLGT